MAQRMNVHISFVDAGVTYGSLHGALDAAYRHG
jgi:hypothetical protein